MPSSDARAVLAHNLAFKFNVDVEIHPPEVIVVVLELANLLEIGPLKNFRHDKREVLVLSADGLSVAYVRKTPLDCLLQRKGH